jgi:hypothetical protein
MFSLPLFLLYILNDLVVLPKRANTVSKVSVSVEKESSALLSVVSLSFLHEAKKNDDNIVAVTNSNKNSCLI